MITLRASNAPRWTSCAASVRLEARDDALPDDDHDAAAEGTAAAWVAECVIEGDAHTADDMVGRVHANGVEIDPDMARHLTPYIDMARSRRDAGAEIYLATQVTSGLVIAGTSDLHSWSTDQDFHIDDLKYGFGIKEPTSPQLWVYAALAFWNGVRAARWHLGIYQPRAQHNLGPYRTITVTQAEVEAVAQTLVQLAMRVADPTSPAMPGGHCGHCLAAARCAALTHSIYAMWAPVRSREVLDPTDQQIADEMEMLEQMTDLLSARQAAVQAEAQERMRGGKLIPGWAMMARVGQRKFRYDRAVIHGLTQVDPTVMTTCTPAELERRGVSKALVERLSYQPTVGYKIGRYDDRQIARMFKK